MLIEMFDEKTMKKSNIQICCFKPQNKMLGGGCHPRTTAELLQFIIMLQIAQNCVLAGTKASC